jgi:primosomal protein N' (replication factor Y)
MPVLRLAIPSPLRRLFDYLPPVGITGPELAALRPGQRLRVPFGQRQLTGYLLSVQTSSELPADALKHALEILDPQPLIHPTLLQLCDWATRYYHHPAGEVLSAAFPRALRAGGEPRLATDQPGHGATGRGPRQVAPPGRSAGAIAE